MTSPGGRAADHPRSRGVYAQIRGTTQQVVGSSPLARGLLDGGLASTFTIGIIPARAGFTIDTRGWIWLQWDHPRSRGVYGGDPVPGVDGCGSSPLARGLLRSSETNVGNVRIIPARAGFTR